MMVADKGFLLCEIDKSASESYCTALLSGDKVLWSTLHSGRDFHCSNASMFFGIPYEELYDDKNKKVLNKPLRQLAKPVNHGANYNMGAAILVETMGEQEVYAAKNLLLESYAKYPTATSKQKALMLSRCKELKQIAQFLLDTFHNTYTGISKVWYQEVANEVMSTSKIVSPSGWSRYCFSNPVANKMALNSYIAHGPQHLSVMLLNRGFYKLFKELQDPNTFRLKAQIHDSILFQYREDREDLVHKANEILMGTIVFRGKSLTIPNDASYGKLHWSNLK
jgi:DNA polymerase I-like protein with 3'-5' exonuclease and polymerase domains